LIEKEGLVKKSGLPANEFREFVFPGTKSKPHKLPKLNFGKID